MDSVLGNLAVGSLDFSDGYMDLAWKHTAPHIAETFEFANAERNRRNRIIAAYRFCGANAALHITGLSVSAISGENELRAFFSRALVVARAFSTATAMGGQRSPLWGLPFCLVGDLLLLALRDVKGTGCEQEGEPAPVIDGGAVVGGVDAIFVRAGLPDSSASEGMDGVFGRVRANLVAARTTLVPAILAVGRSWLADGHQCLVADRAADVSGVAALGRASLARSSAPPPPMASFWVQGNPGPSLAMSLTMAVEALGEVADRNVLAGPLRGVALPATLAVLDAVKLAASVSKGRAATPSRRAPSGEGALAADGDDADEQRQRRTAVEMMLAVGFLAELRAFAGALLASFPAHTTAASVLDSVVHALRISVLFGHTLDLREAAVGPRWARVVHVDVLQMVLRTAVTTVDTANKRAPHLRLDVLAAVGPETVVPVRATPAPESADGAAGGAAAEPGTPRTSAALRVPEEEPVYHSATRSSRSTTRAASNATAGRGAEGELSSARPPRADGGRRVLLGGAKRAADTYTSRTLSFSGVGAGPARHGEHHGAGTPSVGGPAGARLPVKRTRLAARRDQENAMTHCGSCRGRLARNVAVACDAHCLPETWYHIKCAGIAKAPTGTIVWFCSQACRRKGRK